VRCVNPALRFEYCFLLVVALNLTSRTDNSPFLTSSTLFDGMHTHLAHVGVPPAFFQAPWHMSQRGVVTRYKRSPPYEVTWVAW
jgi:hypothetical protein